MIEHNHFITSANDFLRRQRELRGGGGGGGSGGGTSTPMQQQLPLMAELARLLQPVASGGGLGKKSS
jgi:hypothetical protein